MNRFNLSINNPNKRGAVFFTILAAFSLWTVDAALDAFILRQGAFSDLFLFNISRHELYSRLLMIGFVVACGGVALIRDRAFKKLLHLKNLDRARSEEKLKESERFLGTIFESFHDPLNIVDREYRLIKFNDAYARMRNKLPKDLFGKKCHEALYDRNSPCEGCIVEKTFQSTDPCAVEKQVTLFGGSETWLEIYTYPILDRNRNVTHVIEYARDITDRKKAEREKNQLIGKLNHLSTADCLTGLFNRRALTDTLRHEIERAQRYCGELSLILCDVDKLKHINDTYGHAAETSAPGHGRIPQEFTRKNGHRGTVAEMNSWSSCLRRRSKAQKASRTKSASVLRSTLRTPDRASRISLSIGIAGCCTATDDSETLIKRADAALYTSKRNGRNMVSTIGV
jgi:PAS domain S-box-containing protein